MIRSAHSTFAALVVAGAALALVPWVASEFVTSLVLSCLMYVALAVSWTLFSGTTRYLSLATSAFFGLGAYSCAWFVESWPWWAVVVAGALMAAVFAGIIGMVTLRLRGAYFAVVTFGLTELAKHAIMIAEKSLSGSVGRTVTDAPPGVTVYLTVLGLAALVIGARAWLGRSLLGRSAVAIGMDEGRVPAIGVNALRVKLVLFIMSATFAGAVGAAMAARWSYIEPLTVFNPFISFQTVLVSMVGGPGSLWGPVVSAVAFSLISELLRFTLPDLYLILLGLVLIAIVLFPPARAAAAWRQRRRHPSLAQRSTDVAAHS